MSDEMDRFVEEVSGKKVEELEKKKKEKKDEDFSKDELKPKIPENEKDVEGLDYITEDYKLWYSAVLI